MDQPPLLFLVPINTLRNSGFYGTDFGTCCLGRDSLGELEMLSQQVCTIIQIRKFREQTLMIYKSITVITIPQADVQLGGSSSRVID